MWKTIARRLLIMIPQIFVLSILLFILAKFMPGDALTGQIDPKVSPERLEELRVKLGFYDPWPLQYQRWLKNAIKGDFGISYKYKIPVTQLIGQRAVNTFWLSLSTTVMLYLLAVPLGIISGRRHGTRLDNGITLYTYIALAVPTLVFGLLNIYIFAYKARWFPSGGSVNVEITTGTLKYYLDKLYHLLLPSMTVALVSTTGIVQYLRSEIINYSNADFVLTARSKGVPENKIYSKHILRNSLMPIASGFGYTITGLLGGMLFTERIFGYPGMGYLFLDAVLTRDYSVVNALVLLNAVLLILGGLISDIIITIVDPRIRIK